MKHQIRSITGVIALLSVALMAQAGDLVPMGATQYVAVQDAPSLMPPNGLTIECWIYYDDSVPWGLSYPTMVRKAYVGHPYIFRVNASGRKLQFGVGTNIGGYTGFDSTVAITPLTWTHVAATWDGALMTIYIDGVPSGSAAKSGTMSTSTQILLLGTGYDTSETWRGRIDEIRMWDHARTQSELTNSMFSRLDNQPGQIAAWHFDGNFLDLTGGLTGLPQNGLTTTTSTSPVGGFGIMGPTESAVGSPIHFQIQGTPPNAPYFLDNSFAAPLNGTPLTGPLAGTFPLDGPLLNLTFGPMAPGIFVDYLGFTDAQGSASATFNVPNYAHLIGLDLQTAALYLDNLQPMVLGMISPVLTTRLQGPGPVISSFLPIQGPLSGGGPIAIVGQNFLPGATLTIGGSPATNVVVQNSTLITATSPAGMSLGNVSVKVINSDGTSVTAATSYRYVTNLTLSGVTPLNASAGQTVTLNGLGIQPGALISVEGQPATIVQLQATMAQFTMPAGIACHAVVALTNPDGQSASLVMNPGPFTSSTQGATGIWSGGTSFQIYGGNFSPQAQVTVDGALATVVQATSSSLDLISPPGLVGPAVVVITNPDGCTATTSFYYTY